LFFSLSNSLITDLLLFLYSVYPTRRFNEFLTIVFFQMMHSWCKQLPNPWISKQAMLQLFFNCTRTIESICSFFSKACLRHTDVRML